MSIIKLSTMNKTWIIDLDGTLFPHNGYLIDEKEEPLPGVKDFFGKIPPGDFTIIVTSRDSTYREATEMNLKRSEIRWNMLIMDIPRGERILINDSKPSGLVTAHAITLQRDAGLTEIIIDYSDSL